MADDDVLRITTTVDLNAIVNGIPQAASVFESSTQRMTSAARQFAASTVQLDQQITKTAGSVQASGASFDQLEDRVARSQYSMMEARHGVMLLGEELGARMPRAVATFIASIAPVGALLEVAFPILAVVALLDVITKAITAHDQYIQKLHEAEEATVTLDSKELDRISSLQAVNLKLEDQIGKLEGRPAKNQLAIALLEAQVKADELAISLDADAKESEKLLEQSGADTLANRLKALSDELKGERTFHLDTSGLQASQQALAGLSTAYRNVLQAQAEQAHTAIGDEEAQVAAIKNTAAQWKAYGDAADAAFKKIQAAGAADPEVLNNLTQAAIRGASAYQQLSAQAVQFHDDVVRAQKEGAKDQAEPILAAAKAQAEAIKTVSMASVKFQEQSAKELYELGIISNDEKLAALKASADQEYEIEKAKIARLKTLTQQKAALGDTAAPSELESLEAEREALEVTHQAKLSAIVTQGEMERRKMADSNALATVQGAQKIADARANGEEEAARQQRALKKISIDQETADLIAAENERYAAEVATKNKELELAKQHPEQKGSEIISLNAEVEAAEVAHQAKLSAITAQGNQQRMAEAKAAMQEQVSASRELGNVELEVAKRTADEELKTHQVSTMQWRQMQIAAINQWAASERAALEQELTTAKTIYGENATQYKALMDKLRLLDMQRAADVAKYNTQIQVSFTQLVQTTIASFQQLAQQINNSMASSLGRWATGWETTGKMLRGLWEQLSTSFGSMIIKIAMQEIEGLVMHKAMSQQQVVTDAGAAAAGAYAATAAIPLIGPAMAPAAAASALAATLALGSAEQGALLDQDTFLQAHAKEMVLPEFISTPLQGMLADYASDKRSSLSVDHTINVSPGSVPIFTGSRLPDSAGSSLDVASGSRSVSLGSELPISMDRTLASPSLSAASTMLMGPHSLPLSPSISSLVGTPGIPGIPGGVGGSGGAGGRGGAGFFASFLDDPIASRRFRTLMSEAFEGSGSHRRETSPEQRDADTLTSAAGSTSPGGMVNLNYHAGSVSALDSTGVSKVLDNNRKHIEKLVHDAVRRGGIRPSEIAKKL